MEDVAILVSDIGGTNARFAIAHPSANQDFRLTNAKQYSVEQFESFDNCLQEYRSMCGDAFPNRAVFAVAAPTGQEEVVFTNSKWHFRISAIKAKFGFDGLQCINDFVAVAHMVAHAGEAELQLVHGQRLSGNREVTTVIGPGTGLGVSYITPLQDDYLVQETEASHIGFSPVDDFEAQLHAQLKNKYGRVSTERLGCGAGLGEFYRLLAGPQDVNQQSTSDAKIWQLCLSGEDAIATDALHKYCNCLGSIAGDLVLAQGSSRLAMVGSLAGKLANIIPQTDFIARFHAKGRFSSLLTDIPIELLDVENPGLKGAVLSAL